MAGRKRKPSNIHKLHGNPGRRPLPKNEPEPDLGLPNPPSWIEPGTVRMAVWDEFAAELDAMEVLTLADRAALAMLVSAYCDWLEADDAVAEHGITQKRGSKKTGYSTVARPEVAIRSDAWKRYRSMLAEFGLMPSSRSRVSATGKPSLGKLARFLEGG